MKNKIDGRISLNYEYGEIIKERQNEMRTFNIINIILAFLQELKERSIVGDKLAYFATKKIF
jgi:hypothetical protein